MRDETGGKNPIGLYYHPKAKKYVGAIHEAQADAMIQMGFELHKEGLEAAMAKDPNGEAEAPEVEEEVQTAPAAPVDGPTQAPAAPAENGGE